jgi:transposase
MTRKENQSFASRVFHFYKNCADCDKNKTVKNFVKENYNKQTIYRIISRFEATGDVKYKSIPGRPIVKSSPKQVRKVEKAFNSNPNVSVREAAKKLKMDYSTVSRIKVKKLGITARTLKKAPKYVKDQKKRAKTGLRKI